MGISHQQHDHLQDDDAKADDDAKPTRGMRDDNAITVVCAAVKHDDPRSSTC